MGVGIQPITNNAINGTDPAYRFTPEGTTFAQPVQLTFAYGDALVAGSAPQALEIATQDAQGYWWLAPSPTRDPTAKTISVAIPHFSDWSLLLGVQLAPRSATVRVSGTQDLSLVNCVDEADDLMAPPVPGAHTYDCSGDLASPDSTSNWSVNGAPEGTTGLGIVKATSSKSGRYTAPATLPVPPTVTVSASVAGTSYGTLILVSNISIAGGGYAGSMDLTAGDDDLVMSAQHVEVAWTRADPDPLTASGGATYKATGGYWTATFSAPTCDSQTVTEDLDPAGSILELYGPASTTPNTYHFVIGTVPEIVTFSCHGVPAPTRIAQTITEPCPSQDGTTTTLMTYTDPNNLASTGPTAVTTTQGTACGPVTATWAFTPH
jgi:hypothetical protein